MNQKFTIQQLAEEISARTGLDKTEVVGGLKSIFLSLSAQLTEARSARIDGFGRFDVGDCGEILFSPDESLASVVNSPFETFPEVELSEDYVEEYDDESLVGSTEKAVDDSVVESYVVEEEALTVSRQENEPENVDNVELSDEADLNSSTLDEQLPPPYDPYKAYSPSTNGYVIQEEEEEFSDNITSSCSSTMKFLVGLLCGIIIALGVCALALFLYIYFIK